MTRPCVPSDSCASCDPSASSAPCAMKGLWGRHRVLLAPMAGVSDVAFRALCVEQGADLAFTEMVSAKGLSYANEKTRHLLDLAPGERSVGVQLFGHEPGVLAAQAAWVEDALGVALSHIDLNMGCPARKIVSKGDGSALMDRPELAADIVRAVKGAVSCPITVKFRRGTRLGRETAPDFARRMEAAGADALAVHGRYAEQLYRGAADWGAVARVKRAVGVPVVGNGDVRCGADALAMHEATGCDAVMLGRAAQGNPWVFADVQAALDGRPASAPPTVDERLSMARRHARMLAAREGQNIVRMRKHAVWYVAGMPGAAAARARINACSTPEDFDAVFDELLEIAHEHARAQARADDDANAGFSVRATFMSPPTPPNPRADEGARP